jgi:hypothetical protein
MVHIYCSCMTKSLRFLLCAFLPFVCVSEASAQARAEPAPVTFSVAAGFNMSRLNFSLPFDDELLDDIGGSFDDGSRFGLVIGGLVDFRIAPGVNVLTGGLMSPRGSSIELTIPELDLGDIDLPDFTGTIELDTRMIYVDVPAFVAVGVARAGENRFEAIGGAMIGFRAHARQKFTGFGLSEEQEFTDELPAVDFGLSIGGRYTCGHIFAAAYYTWGLTDLTDGDSSDPIKHRYLTVIGGWRF